VDQAEVVKYAQLRGGAWSLLVLRGDETVLEARRNCGPDDLFYTFSVGKPLTALAVHLLAHRGRLDLDEPIAHHWPKYARHGKATITPRHVLTHTAGVPLSTGSELGDMLAMRWPRLSTWLAQRARPVTPPGEALKYHIISFGFILGELVRRVDGRPIERFIQEEFFTPLGLDHSHLSLPRGLQSHAVPLRGQTRPDRFTAYGINRRAGRRAVVPASSLQTTARDLGAFYRVLLRDGATADGTQVIPPDVVHAARQPVQPSLPRYGTGFQLGGLGSKPDPTTFGHNGSNVCTAWADPVADVVFCYLTDTVHQSPSSFVQMGLVADAAWTCALGHA
jgi:CubicO group peptidase (beta-lactamase class C family)